MYASFVMLRSVLSLKFSRVLASSLPVLSPAPGVIQRRSNVLSNVLSVGERGERRSWKGRPDVSRTSRSSQWDGPCCPVWGCCRRGGRPGSALVDSWDKAHSGGWGMAGEGTGVGEACLARSVSIDREGLRNTWGCNSSVECLLSMHEVAGSTPSLSTLFFCCPVAWHLLFFAPLPCAPVPVLVHWCHV